MATMNGPQSQPGAIANLLSELSHQLLQSVEQDSKDVCEPNQAAIALLDRICVAQGKLESAVQDVASRDWQAVSDRRRVLDGLLKDSQANLQHGI